MRPNPAQNPTQVSLTANTVATTASMLTPHEDTHRIVVQVTGSGTAWMQPGTNPTTGQGLKASDGDVWEFSLTEWNTFRVFADVGSALKFNLIPYLNA
jgi:hypothetical protein